MHGPPHRSRPRGRSKTAEQETGSKMTIANHIHQIDLNIDQCVYRLWIGTSGCTVALQVIEDDTITFDATLDRSECVALAIALGIMAERLASPVPGPHHDRAPLDTLEEIEEWKRREAAQRERSK